MGTQVIKNKPSWLGDLNIGDYAHALAMDYGADAVDNTVLTDTTHSNAGGLLTFGFSCDAYADFTNADSAVFADVALTRGIIEFNSSATSSSTTTGSQLGAVSAAQRIVANLHVTTAVGSALDVIVQSDDNSGFTSPTNRNRSC